MAMIDDLAAAFDGHQVTDEDGSILDEGTSLEESAPSQEQTAEEETAEVETTAEPEPEAPQAEEEDPESVAEDDSGRRYIPEKRFSKVYGELKQTQRELEALKSLRSNPQMANATQSKTQKADKVDIAASIETELLLDKYPQFDPNSADYSLELDQTAFDIWRANKDSGMTRLQAAREAVSRASKLTEGIRTTRVSNLAQKSQLADSGIASRAVSSKPSQSVDVNKMSETEMEEYLRSTGNW